MKRWLCLALLPACTTLGPMPATTGVSAIPANRPGVELQTGIMPGSYLSDSAHDTDPATVGPNQASVVVEPSRHGLVVGMRQFGQSGDTPVEPMIGLRRKLDDTFAVAGIGYGTYAHGAQQGASYNATRLGGELAIDATLLPMFSWLALHVQAAVSATYLDANGTYCVDSVGSATDCDDRTRRVTGDLAGIYTAATAAVSVDLARRPTGYVHGVRLQLLGAVGGMPRIRDGKQERSDDRYHSIGLALTLGFGADK